MSKKTSKANYELGTWVAIPLPEAGYTIGIIVGGDSGSGVLLGYFFPELFSKPPALQNLKNKTAAGAVLIAWFGDLGIRQGRWPILGKEKSFERQDWPVPSFGRVDATNPQKGYVTEYNLETPIKGQPVRETRCNSEELLDLPYDGLYGATALEAKLNAMLKPE